MIGLESKDDSCGMILSNLNNLLDNDLFLFAKCFETYFFSTFPLSDFGDDILVFGGLCFVAVPFLFRLLFHVNLSYLSIPFRRHQVLGNFPTRDLVSDVGRWIGKKKKDGGDVRFGYIIHHSGQTLIVPA